jgi:hypothetical protein
MPSLLCRVKLLIFKIFIMKKKIVYGSLLAIAFVLSFVFKAKNDENMQQAELDPTVLISWIGDIEIGTQNCVCKGGSCSEANWISFRKACGDTTGWGGNTNAACQQVDAGNCN